MSPLAAFHILLPKLQTANQPTNIEKFTLLACVFFLRLLRRFVVICIFDDTLCLAFTISFIECGAIFCMYVCIYVLCANFCVDVCNTNIFGGLFIVVIDVVFFCLFFLL